MSAKKKTRARKAKREQKSRGLDVAAVASMNAPAAVSALGDSIEADGGRVLGVFREPVGGHWQLFAALPIDKVQPTPFQRDLSDAHVARLAHVIDRLDRFVDPVVVVRQDGAYWTPNGHHRTAAMREIGARSIVALVVPEPEVAYQILALNTEKAHNLREKSLEVIRMARSLAALSPRPEKEYALQFEEAAFLTLGLCYQENGRFAGGAYHPLLKRIDDWLSARLDAALVTRAERAKKVLALEEQVDAAVKRLRARGFQSPYLRAFVVARVNPLRFKRGATGDFDGTLATMTAAASRFDADKIKPEQLAAASGPPDSPA